jgi:transaldolase
VVVKLVASRAGAAACARLASRGIPTLLTAIYHPGQAIIAAAAGATYIAPYFGRLDDAGRDALGDVTAMHEVLSAGGSGTKILLASIRDVGSMVTLARGGVQHFTMAPAVAEMFFDEELTAAAVRTFEEAVAASTP